MINPQISIIIPVYNVEIYLKECLDSCINQTLEDIEIICVDDASPDNSIKILEEYQKKDFRIKIFRQKKNKKQEATSELCQSLKNTEPYNLSTLFNLKTKYRRPKYSIKRFVEKIIKKFVGDF